MKRYISFALSALCMQAFGADCDLKNGITSGQVCTPLGDKTLGTNLNNAGTLVLNSWIDLTFRPSAGSSDSFSLTSSDTKAGQIQVLGNSTIAAYSSNDPANQTLAKFSITNQNITIADGKRLIFKTNELTLGESDKNTTISATTKADLSIQEAQSVHFKNASFKNLTITANDTAGLNITKADFENTTAIFTGLTNLSLKELKLNKSTISTNQDLKIVSPSTSTFNLAGENHITASNSTLKVDKGTYNFEGGGSLIFSGGNGKDQGVKVGANKVGANNESDQVILKGKNSTEEDKAKTFIAFRGETTFENVKAEDLTLRIFNELHNTKLALVDSTLEGRDGKGQSQTLIINNNQVKGGNNSISSGVITISKKNDATEGLSTIFAKEIEIYGQTINIGQDGETANITLDLKTDDNAGTITLGRANTDKTSNGASVDNRDGEVVIKGNLQALDRKQTLKIGANQILIGSNGKSEITKGKAGGNVTLQDLSIQTQSKDAKGLTFGLQSGSNLTFNNIELSTQSLEGDKKYQALTFSSTEKDSTLKVVKTSTLKASSFAFKNQKVILTENKDFDLYAYGALKEGETPKESAVFNFSGSTFERIDASLPATNPRLNLYSHKGAKLIGEFTLKDIDLSSKTLEGSSTDLANLDLTDSSSSLRALGRVDISASEFSFGKGEGDKVRQGVGMNLFVGSAIEAGDLTLKSNGSNEGFTIGSLTLDHRSKNVSQLQQSVFDVEITDKSNNVKSLRDLTLGLEINGALSVLHQNLAGQTSEMQAKIFDFKERASVSVENGTLKLISKGETIEINGKTILAGSEIAPASIGAFQSNNSTSATLSLHDIEVRGKATLGEETTFTASNLTINKEGAVKGNLEITNTTKEVTGIQSISLNDATLHINNGGGNQGLILDRNATITSKGVSSIQASSLDVNSGGTFALSVKDGTLTILESAAKDNKNTSIGAITLGEKGNGAGAKSIGANLVLKKGTTPVYNALQINSTITSYGDSNITADEFSIASLENTKEPIFSIHQGELALIAIKTSQPADPTLSIAKGIIELDGGTLAVYTKEDKGVKRGSITLGNDVADPKTAPQIISKGDSKIIANYDSSLKQGKLTIKGSEIISLGGKLTLVGLSGDSVLGNATMKNNGSFTALKSEGGEQVAIKIAGKLEMISSTPYIKVEKGKPSVGGFGSIQAQSLLFTSSTEKLINLKILSDETNPKISGESLFALREGDKPLIETQEGIKKGNENFSQASSIGYNDISTDLGGYKSLELTPILQCGAKDKDGNPTACKLEGSQLAKGEIARSLILNIKVKQSSIDEVIEQLDVDKRKQMEDFLSQGRYREIADSILSAPSNALKIGIVANILKEIGTEGNMELALEALGYSSDAFDTMANLIKTNHRNFEQISSLSFGSLQNRMARLGNPHTPQKDLASLIKSASKYRYASNDDEILLTTTEEKELDKGGLWASYDGVMRSGRSVSSSVNGLSAGYDGIVGENILLGGFVSYLYGQYNGEFLANSSHNLHFGFYSRMAFGGNEIDLVLSQMIAFNQGTLILGQTQVPALLNGKVGFNMYASDVQARYGYAFALGSEESPYYLKPLVGVDMSFIADDSVKTEEAIQSIYAPKRTHFRLDVLAGVELRKYFNPHSYFFVLPLVETGIVNLGNDAEVGFAGAKSLLYQFDSQKDINVGIYAGGQGSVAENLAISGGLGLKVGVKNTEVITSWNVGLRYKF